MAGGAEEEDGDSTLVVLHGLHFVNVHAFLARKDHGMTSKYRRSWAAASRAEYTPETGFFADRHRTRSVQSLTYALRLVNL